MARPSKRQEVLEAGALLFGQHGFDAVSVKEVADAAGIRLPSLYRHFSTKQELFDEVLRWACQGVITSERFKFYSSDALPEQKLKHFVYTAVHVHGTRPYLRKLLQQALVSEDRRTIETIVHKVYADQHSLMVDAIRVLDPNSEPYFKLYILLSLSLGFVYLRPLQDVLRALTTRERNPEFLAATVLEMTFPDIEWETVSLVDLSPCT
ncbi:MAG: TetR/AcrR family transcriptional regulator [Porticoccaceae bacterium]